MKLHCIARIKCRSTCNCLCCTNCGVVDEHGERGLNSPALSSLLNTVTRLLIRVKSNLLVVLKIKVLLFFFLNVAVFCEFQVRKEELK